MGAETSIADVPRDWLPIGLTIAGWIFVPLFKASLAYIAIRRELRERVRVQARGQALVFYRDLVIQREHLVAACDWLAGDVSSARRALFLLAEFGALEKPSPLDD